MVDVCHTTHFGRKEDESCTHVMMIEEIVDKMISSKPGTILESDWVECGNVMTKLLIFPNGGIEEYVGNISVGVVVKLKNTEGAQWKRIGILGAENSNGFFFKSISYLKSKSNQLGAANPNVRFVWDKFLPHTKVLDEKNSSFFPNGVLTVKAIIKIQGEEIVTSRTSKLPLISETQLKGELSGQFRKMLDSHRFSDCKIICQGETIPCHRNVLSARSEIFGAMFEDIMKESETGEVEIKDFDVGTIKAMVIYMYTGELGEVDLTNEINEQLIRAADKYLLNGLKKMIEAVLIKSVKIENSIQMFVLGDAVHANSLRDASKEIIVRNAAAIVELDGWKQALGRFPDLAMEVFESVAKKSKNL